MSPPRKKAPAKTVRRAPVKRAPKKAASAEVEVHTSTEAVAQSADHPVIDGELVRSVVNDAVQMMVTDFPTPGVNDIWGATLVTAITDRFTAEVTRANDAYAAIKTVTGVVTS